MFNVALQMNNSQEFLAIFFYEFVKSQAVYTYTFSDLNVYALFD